MAKFKNNVDRDYQKTEHKNSDLFTVITEDEYSVQNSSKPAEEAGDEVLKKLLDEEAQRLSAAEEEEKSEPAAALPQEEQTATATEDAEDTPSDDSTETENSEIEDKHESPVLRESSSIDIESVTVITKGTTLNGSITSDCSLDVMGTINGDIECLGKLTISGKVTGNAIASEVYINADRFDGSITSEGGVKIGIGTVVLGDIIASSAVIAGAVKGNLDVQGYVVIDSTAIIKGNIRAKSLQINNGAILEGNCSLPYATVDIDKIFE